MKQLLFIFCLIAAFIACNDDDDNNKDNPTLESPIKELVMPSATTPFTTGQTVTIQGKGFTANSEIWLRNITKAEDDIPTTITNVDDSSISFTVPEKVSGEKQVILKQDGEQYLLGKLTFESVEKTEENLYGCCKIEDENQKQFLQILQIDLNSFTAKEIAKIDFGTSSIGDIFDMIGIPSTKEIICYIREEFIKINQETGKFSIIEKVEAGGNLVIDKNENIYSYNYEGIKKEERIHKILVTDKNTGKTETFTTLDFGNNNEIYNMVCLAESNEIIGLIDEGLIKIDLNSKESEIIPIDPAIYGFTDLISDKNENLYAFRNGSSENPFLYLEKIDKNTGKTELFADLKGIASSFYITTYLTSSNEIIAIDTHDILVKINLSTGEISSASIKYPLEDIVAN